MCKVAHGGTYGLKKPYRASALRNPFGYARCQNNVAFRKEKG